MALITISSQNEHLGYVLRKNPHSGMTIQSLRKGCVFGWFETPTVYHIMFKDPPNQMSFSKESFDYLDNHSLTDPLTYVSAMKTVLSDAIFKKEQHDVVTEQSIVVHHINLKPHLLSLLNEHFTVTHNRGNCTLQLAVNATLKEALELMYLNLCFHISQDELDYRRGGFTDTVVKTLREKQCSYMFLRSFINKIVSNRAEFDKHKAVIEAACDKTVNFQYSRLNQLRYNWAEQHLNKDVTVVDVGCGEGNMLKVLARYSNNIICVDSDPHKLETVIHKARKKEIPISTASSFDELHLTQPTSVLLLEVIEHNSLADASKLLTQICSDPNVNQVLLTTPNHLFNQFYNLTDEEMRHTDHKWEMNLEQLTEWINSLNLNKTATYHLIGDAVEGITPTVGVQLK